MLEELRQWRRDLHRHPEPAWAEFRTTALVAAELSRLGYKVRVGEQVLYLNAVMGRQIDVAREKARALAQGADPQWLEPLEYTGLVAELDTGRPGPCVALRVDMDAVKVQESDSNDHVPFQLGFASVNEGCTHACGHDGHTALGVVLAKRLVNQVEHLSGRIKLFFQPAEEGCRGGKAMALSGQLDDVDVLYAIHLGIHAKSGELVVAPTNFLSSTKFDVEFIGTPAHAGLEPNAGANALAAACNAVTQLLAIPRHRDGLTRLNVGRLTAGQDRNVIPAHALLEGETRGGNASLNDYMFGRVQQIVAGVAASYGVDYRIRKQGEAISIDNSPTLVHAVTLCADRLGFNVIHSRPFGASDDAGYMLERVQKRGGQAAYLVLGADLAAGHHHHAFDFDESVLETGLALLEQLFVDNLQLPAGQAASH